MRINHSIAFQRRQQGVALITGLIFMVVLTLIAITAARMAGLEERMSGNMRDRSLAMQAAEMALRDAERDILYTGRINGISKFEQTCPNGLCHNGLSGKKNGVDWNITPAWSLVNMTAAPSVAYGTFTGATAIGGLPAQPRYIIEGIYKNIGGDNYYYRITVRAQGVNPNTVVWLQEVFLKP